MEVTNQFVIQNVSHYIGPYMQFLASDGGLTRSLHGAKLFSRQEALDVIGKMDSAVAWDFLHLQSVAQLIFRLCDIKEQEQIPTGDRFIVLATEESNGGFAVFRGVKAKKGKTSVLSEARLFSLKEAQAYVATWPGHEKIVSIEQANSVATLSVNKHSVQRKFSIYNI